MRRLLVLLVPLSFLVPPGATADGTSLAPPFEDYHEATSCTQPVLAACRLTATLRPDTGEVEVVAGVERRARVAAVRANAGVFIFVQDEITEAVESVTYEVDFDVDLVEVELAGPLASRRAGLGAARATFELYAGHDGCLRCRGNFRPGETYRSYLVEPGSPSVRIEDQSWTMRIQVAADEGDLVPPGTVTLEIRTTAYAQINFMLPGPDRPHAAIQARITDVRRVG